MAAADRHQMQNSRFPEIILQSAGIGGIDAGSIGRVFRRHVILSENAQCQPGNQHLALIRKPAGLYEKGTLHHIDKTEDGIRRANHPNVVHVGQPYRHAAIVGWHQHAVQLVCAVLPQHGAVGLIGVYPYTTDRCPNELAFGHGLQYGIRLAVIGAPVRGNRRRNDMQPHRNRRCSLPRQRRGHVIPLHKIIGQCGAGACQHGGDACHGTTVPSHQLGGVRAAQSQRRQSHTGHHSHQQYDGD